MNKQAIVNHQSNTSYIKSSRKDRLVPKVPEYNHKPLKPIWNNFDVKEYATDKQKAMITVLCDRRKIPVPYLKHMKKGEAAQMISNMLNTPYWNRK